MMTIFKEKLLRFPQRNLPGESECPEKGQGTDSLTAPALGTGPPGRRPQGADEAGGGGGKRRVDTCTRRRMTAPQTRDREHSAGHSLSHARDSAHARMLPNTARCRGLGTCSAFSPPGRPSPPTSPTTDAAYSSGRSCCWLAAAASRGPRPHLTAARPEGSRDQSTAQAAA